MKFCRDCRFVQFVDGVNAPIARCTYTLGTRLDLVTGESVPVKQRWDYCGALRAGPGGPDACGEEAQFFQPRSEQVAA